MLIALHGSHALEGGIRVLDLFLDVAAPGKVGEDGAEEGQDRQDEHPATPPIDLVLVLLPFPLPVEGADAVGPGRDLRPAGGAEFLPLVDGGSAFRTPDGRRGRDGWSRRRRGAAGQAPALRQALVTLAGGAAHAIILSLRSSDRAESWNGSDQGTSGGGAEQQALQDAVEVLGIAEADLKQRRVELPSGELFVPGQADHVPDPGDVVVDDGNDLRRRAAAVLRQIGEEALAAIHALLEGRFVVHES